MNSRVVSSYCKFPSLDANLRCRARNAFAPRAESRLTLRLGRTWPWGLSTTSIRDRSVVLTLGSLKESVRVGTPATCLRYVSLFACGWPLI